VWAGADPFTFKVPSSLKKIYGTIQDLCIGRKEIYACTEVIRILRNAIFIISDTVPHDIPIRSS